MHTHRTDTRYTHTPQQYRTQIQQSCSTYKIAQNRTEQNTENNNMQHTEQNTEYREQNNTGAEQRTTHNLNTEHSTEHSTDNLNTYRKTLYVNVITYKHLYTR